MTKINPAIAGHVMEENEKLRGLLTQALEFTEANTCGGPDVAQLIAEMRAALSQQAGPDHVEDMRAMVEPAGAQDEREAFEVWAAKRGLSLVKYAGGMYTCDCTMWADIAWQERATRPAQTEQQPVKLQHMAYAEDGALHWASGRKIDNCELYAMPDFGRAPQLYDAPQPEQTALSAVTAERDRLREQVAALQSGANSWQSGYDKGRGDGAKSAGGWKDQHARDSAELRRLCAERDQLRAEVERLRKALEQFADDGNWCYDTCNISRDVAKDALVAKDETP